MSRTLEDAQVVLGQAATCIDQHDGIVEKLTANRANYELAMLRPDDQFNFSEMVDKLQSVREVIQKFGARLAANTEYVSMDEFRRAFTKAKHQISILAEYQEVIDRKSFYLDIYEQSGHPPDLDKGEEFDLEKEKLKLENIKAQYDYALGQFLELAFSLDIGEPTNIVPAGLVSPSGSRI